MTTKLEPKPSTTDGSDDFCIHHTTCCDDDIALCGEDVVGWPETDGTDELICIVCEDLNKDYIPCSTTCLWID